MAHLAEAGAVVAEVTLPSHGVGYEVARAEASTWLSRTALGKPVLCLHRRNTGRRLSAMLAGNPALRCEIYDGVAELGLILQFPAKPAEAWTPEHLSDKLPASPMGVIPRDISPAIRRPRTSP